MAWGRERLLDIYVILGAIIPLFYEPVSAHSGLQTDHEVRLTEFLFGDHKGYNPLIRPVANSSDNVLVKFELAMVQIIRVEEKTQVMMSNVWLRFLWYDYQLKWEPEDFGGIEMIRVSADSVWKPDIVLFNNADGNYEVAWKPLVLLGYGSDITWIPPANYMSSCTIDVTFFPFDEQVCLMKFGSWTYDATEVTLGWLDNTNVDLTEYWRSGTWDLTSLPGKIINETKPGQPPTTSIVYDIGIRRKTLFYVVNLIVPCVLISFLSICVFYLPADGGEKITLCISVLLALVVFLLLISKILPPTSVSIPLISKYLLFTFMMNIISIFITVVTINWNYRTPRTHTMPTWVRVVFMIYLPKMLFMGRLDHIEAELRTKKRLHETGGHIESPKTSGGDASSEQIEMNKLKNKSREDLSNSEQSPSPPSLPRHRNLEFTDNDLLTQRDGRSAETTALMENEGSSRRHHPRCRMGQQREENGLVRESISQDNWKGAKKDASERFRGIHISHETREAVTSINYISAHLETDDEIMRVLMDWKYVAAVIDTLMLVIFIAVTLVGTIYIIMNAPAMMKYTDQDKVIRENTKSFV